MDIDYHQATAPGNFYGRSDVLSSSITPSPAMDRLLLGFADEYDFRSGHGFVTTTPCRPQPGRHLTCTLAKALVHITPSCQIPSSPWV
ncbi:MAG: hypothetical protein R3D55_04875 [Chloroflexota bacterium]